MRKGRRALITVLALLTASSAAALTVGALRLFDVEDSVERSAAAAREHIAGGGAAVVSFVPGRAGSVSVRSAQTEGMQMGEAEAVLTFCHKKNASVAVFAGTDAGALERGAGRALQAAFPNAVGRCVLHGHRDSAFKPLAKIEEGDRLVLETAGEERTYAVTKIFVTDPSDPAIYEAADHRQLALVTCYPFTFVGPAPDRCVVIADEVGEGQRGNGG